MHSLFHASAAGVEASALVYRMIESAKANKLNVFQGYELEAVRKAAGVYTEQLRCVPGPRIPCVPLGYASIRVLSASVLFNLGSHACRRGTHLRGRSIRCNCRQAFKSGEVTPKEANQIGLEHGLSIVEDPKPSRDHYGTWLGSKKQPSFQEQIRRAIDAALEEKPKDFEELLKSWRLPVLKSTGNESTSVSVYRARRIIPGAIRSKVIIPSRHKRADRRHSYCKARDMNNGDKTRQG